jgi:hypothetical protein
MPAALANPQLLKTTVSLPSRLPGAHPGIPWRSDMTRTPYSTEKLTVTVKMSKVYPQPARPGFAWFPQYSAQIPEVRLTAANGRLTPTDGRDLPLYISEGSKVEFKRKVKRLLPNAEIVWPV